MMNAADDAQLDDLNSSINDQSNKINSSFGLSNDTPKPFTIPSTLTQNQPNFFNLKPIISTDVKEPAKLGDLNNKLSSDILNKTSTIQKPITPPINPFISSAAFQPPPSILTTQKSTGNLLTLATPPVDFLTTTIAPPISVALAQPPPMANASFTPSSASSGPPSTALTNGSIKQPSNPYSARGALNKKVYEPVTSVPVQPPANLAPPIPLQEIKPQTNNFYVPPPPQPSSTPATSATPTQELQTQFNQPPPTNTSFMNPNTPTSPYITPVSSSYQPPQSQYPQETSQYNIETSFNLSNQISSMNIDNSTTNRQPQKNVWNWLTQNRLVNSLKTGVESVITTIDPQMRSYIHNENQHLYLINTNTDKLVSDSIKESFNAAGFLRLTVYEYNIPTTNLFAVQIVSHACALQACQEKINNTIQQMQQDCIVVATQDFLTELTQDSWFDQTCIMFKDKTNNIDITYYTEAIPVPLELVKQLQQKTYANYGQKWSGYSSRLSDNSTMIDWYDMMYGLNRKNLLINAFRSITSIYKYKLMNPSNK